MFPDCVCKNPKHRICNENARSGKINIIKKMLKFSMLCKLYNLVNFFDYIFVTKLVSKGGIWALFRQLYRPWENGLFNGPTVRSFILL